jgi:hypothetical protein
MKFKRTPLLQFLLDFRQFWQIGRPSSHFKCRSLHVKQPVRTRFGLLAAWDSAEVAEPSAPFAPPPLAAFITGLEVLLYWCSRLTLLRDRGL